MVVNDAATLPGSLRGRTADGHELELRLSGPVTGNRLDVRLRELVIMRIGWQTGSC